MKCFASRTRACLLALAILPGIEIGAKPSLRSESSQNTYFRQKILNGKICVPNNSRGYHPVDLKGGKYIQGNETVVIDCIVFGIMKGKPRAVAVMSNWTGGSGIFYSLILYELKNGRAVSTGSYGIGDRVTVKFLTFKNDVVRLARKWTIGEEAGKIESVSLKLEDFEKAECIQENLTEEMTSDLDQLTNLYEKVFFANKVTPEQQAMASQIWKKHKHEQPRFKELFRLNLQSHGFTPKRDFLQISADGKARISVEQNKVLIEL